MPDKNRTFLDELSREFRVIIMRQQYFATEDNGTIEFAEDLLSFSDFEFDVKAFSWDLQKLANFTNERLASWLPEGLGNEMTLEEYRRFYEVCFQMNYVAKYFEKLHEKVGIDLVISNADCSAIRRCVVVQAKRFGIPTVDIEHGFNYSLMPDPELLQEPVVPYPMFISDYVNLDNNVEVEKWQAYFRHVGRDPAPAFVANGTPNDVSGFTTLTKTQAKQIINLDAEKAVVTIVGSWNEARDTSVVLQAMCNEVEFYKCALGVLAKAQSETSFQIVVKLHPAYSQAALFDSCVAYLGHLATDLGIQIALVTTEHLSEILSSSDLLVCASDSSVVWEAFTVGVPSIIMPTIKQLVDYFPKEKLNESSVLARNGWIRYVHNKVELEGEIQHFLKPEIRTTLADSAKKIRDEYQIEVASVHQKTDRLLHWIQNLLPGQTKAKGSQSQNLRALYEKGKALIEADKLREGLAVLSELLELEPQHADTLHLLASLYQKMGQHDKAREMVQLAGEAKAGQKKKVGIIDDGGTSGSGKASDKGATVVEHSPETARAVKSQPKILEVVHDFPPNSYSGTELYTLSLSRELMKLGYDVSVVYPVVREELAPYVFTRSEYEGVRVFEFNVADGQHTKRWDFLCPAYERPFAAFLKTQDFDLVHFQHTYLTSTSWIPVAKELGLPVFLKLDDMYWYCRQIHLMYQDTEACSGPETIDKCYNCRFVFEDGPSPQQFAEAMKYLAFRRAYLQKVFPEVDFVHTPSVFLKNDCAKFGLHNDNFEVIPTGITPFDRIEKTRNGSLADPIRVGFLGDIHNRKGIQILIEAIHLFEKLRVKGVKRDLAFDFYGHAVDDELFGQVMSVLDKLSRVKYHGKFGLADRPRIFSEIDLLAMPSLGENYPFIIREALFADVPVVASRIAGVPEIIQEEQNGYLFEAGNSEQLAHILFEIAANPEKLAKLSPAKTRIKTIAEEAAEISDRFEKYLALSRRTGVKLAAPGIASTAGKGGK